MANPDTTAPTLNGLTLPATIDVTGGARTASFAASAMDVGTGIDYVSVTLDRGIQTQSGRKSTFFFNDSADSFSDGISSQTIAFDSTTAAGTYNVSSVIVYDKAGNYTYYSSSQIAGLGIASSFQVIDRNIAVTATIAAPAYVTEGTDTSFALNLTLRNVSSVSGTVTLSFDAANSTATNGVDVSVPSYSGSYSVSQSPAGDYRIALPSIGVLNDYVAEGTETIAIRVTVSGQIFDTGTDSTIVQVALRDNGLTAAPDTTPPTLTGLTLPTSIDVIGGAKTVNFAASARDAGSGVDRVVLTLDRALQTSTGSITSLTFADGADSFSDGVSGSAVTVAATAALGTYNITGATAYDKAGNAFLYTSGQLATLGIANSFQVVRQPTASVTAPSFVTEGTDTSFALNLTLLNVTSASGAVTLSFDAANSTVTNGVDVNVPNYSSIYFVTQSTPGNYRIALPSIGVLNDYVAEGTETIAIKVTVAGQLFDTGTDSTIVKVALRDNGLAVPPDTTPPTLTGLTLPTRVDVFSGAQIVNFAASAQDTGSGVDRVVLTLDRALQTANGSVTSLTFWDGIDSFSDGVSRSAVAVGADASIGTYTVTGAAVYDKAGNVTSYSSGQLAGLGIANSFQVVRQPTTTAIVTAPVSVTEGNDTSFSLSLRLLNVSSASGTVTMFIDALNSTVTNGTDVTVPSYMGSYAVSQSPAGDYRIALPSIGVLDDAIAEGRETISIRITAPGQIFDNGTDTRIVNIALNDNDIVGTTGNDVMVGTSLNDGRYGGAGNDTIDGGAGNDTIDGGAGNDTINGGTGVDVAIYAAARSATTVTYDAASRSLSVGNAVDGTDTVRHVEQFQFADGLYSFNFASPGGPAVANFNAANGWSSQDGFPRHVADVTGDGYGDIVGFGIGGVFVARGSVGGSYAAATLSVADFGANQGWSSDNLYHRELIDVNGDGRADIVGFGISGMYVSLATTAGFGTATLSVQNFNPANGWSSQDGFTRTLADVNGDGKTDVVGFGIAGTYVALGQGNGMFQGPKLAVANFGANQGWTSDNVYHRALADVNGDGRADIVGFGAAGVYVASGQADGTFGAAVLELANFNPANGWTTQDAYTRLLADVNGDGKADIVGFGQNGVFVANSLGDGHFTAASFDVANFGQAQGWTSDNVFHREVFDVNRDGMADIVGFGIGGVLIALNQNDVVL